MKNNSKCFTNRSCEYFPCHDIGNRDDFNCLFCYCPLYFIECSGNYTLLDDGRKDCSKCILPHLGEQGWEFINKMLFKQMKDS